ncbi:hypothetical protein DSECCO2_500080 [anaerobic digester metagenome]
MNVTETVPIQRLRDRITRVDTGIEDPTTDTCGVPPIGPGVVGLNGHLGEGRRVIVLHLPAEVAEHNTVGSEIRAGQEEVGGVAVGVGSGEGDLLTDGIDTGS